MIEKLQLNFREWREFEDDYDIILEQSTEGVSLIYSSYLMSEESQFTQKQAEILKEFKKNPHILLEEKYKQYERAVRTIQRQWRRFKMKTKKQDEKRSKFIVKTKQNDFVNFESQEEEEDESQAPSLERRKDQNTQTELTSEKVEFLIQNFSDFAERLQRIKGQDL